MFTDASLKKQAGRFVWLSIDTEKEKNAPFLAKYPVEVWPTLMVIDPSTQKAVLRWPGSVDAGQLVKLLDDGERAAGGAGRTAGMEELARADRLNGEGDKTEAAAAYRAALPHLRADDDRARAIESMVSALAMSKEPGSCAAAAGELAPSMPRGPSFASVVETGLECAGRLDGEARTRAVAMLAPLCEEAVKFPGLLADDRSALFATLVDLRRAAGDRAGQTATAARWLAFLEGEAARASGAEQRAAFDPHRVEAALALGEPLRAEAALRQSERDLPADYNPPARLAVIYTAAARYDAALAAIDRALGKVYGPRTIRLEELKADIQLKQGNRAGARKTLQKALRQASALPPEQRRAQNVAQLEKELDALR